MFKRFLGCLLVAGLLTGCGQTPQQNQNLHSENPLSENKASPKAHFELEQKLSDFAYVPQSWPEALKADLWLPERADAAPVVMLIHGGGWSSRDRSDMDDIAEQLVSAGFAAFNVSYRFAPKHTFPAQLNDLMQAKQWLAQHAQHYNLRSDAIAVWGYSAGAHLAALLGSVDTEDGDSNEPRAVQFQKQPKVAAVIAGGTPADLRRYPKSPLVNDFLGGTGSELPEVYEQASPMAHISADDAAVFLYHGEKDFLVEVAQATDYHQALQAAGLETELYLHPWREHSTMFLFGAEAERKAINFLQHHYAR